MIVTGHTFSAPEESRTPIIWVRVLTKFALLDPFVSKPA
jgi:hypothetical protein